MAEEERLHDTSPFTTSRLCMPLQLRNILDENYIAFFLSGAFLVIGIEIGILQDSWFLTM